MMRPIRHPLRIPFLCLCCLGLFLFSLAQAQQEQQAHQEDVCVLESGTGAKCRPLRILTEAQPVTNVGVFCVQQSSPEWHVTFSVPQGYEILDVAFHATPNVSGIPSTGGESFERPAPAKFDFRETQDPPSQNVSMSFPANNSNSLGDLSCGAANNATDKLLYMVAHATVRQPNGDAVEVYAHEGILFQFDDLRYNISQYFSYVRLDCQCGSEIQGNLTNLANLTTSGLDNSTVSASNATLQSNNTMAPSNITTTPSPTRNNASTAEEPTNTNNDTTNNSDAPFDFALPPKNATLQQPFAGTELVVGVSFMVLT
jgi:hypothetical protein